MITPPRPHGIPAFPAPGGSVLSALPGLRQEALLHLLAQGIQTFGQLADMSVGDLDALPGIGRKTAHRLRCYASAFRDNRPIWLGALPEDCRQNGLALDLETDPVDQTPWSFGYSDLAGRAHVAVVAPAYDHEEVCLPDGSVVLLVRNSDDGWEFFAGAVEHCPNLIYHWSAFDAAVMRRTAPEGVKARLEGRMHDLHRTFKHSVALPQRSTSLKPVAKYFGFDWPEGADGGMGWWLAWRDYQLWLAEGDDAALARACAYQRADIDALLLVWRWLVQNAE